MNILYIDAFSGISGDMFLGALVDAGLAEADLRAALATLPIEGYELEVRREKRGSLAATRVEVKLDAKAKQPHRHLSDIETILGAGNGARALEVFRRLAEAEARVHGTTAQEVHFHEVGAVDAIVDIFGVCAGLEILGVERVVSSGLPMGSGHVDAAHGRLPVPAPAVVELMKGVPIRPCDEVGELVTPTGAALAVTLADAFGPMPAMVVEKVGYGAGARESGRVPNVLRVILGQAAGPASPLATPWQGADAAEIDTVWLVEANLDDATGQTVGAATKALFEAGAVDVWVTAATMKKGRPGMVLSCLAPEGLVGAVEEAFFRETPTFGVRRSAVVRSKLAREHVEVETRFGRVRVKVGRRGGRVVTASPEYEDCRRLAAERGAALREVYGAALEAASSEFKVQSSK